MTSDLVCKHLLSELLTMLNRVHFKLFYLDADSIIVIKCFIHLMKSEGLEKEALKALCPEAVPETPPYIR